MQGYSTFVTIQTAHESLSFNTITLLAKRKTAELCPSLHTTKMATLCTLLWGGGGGVVRYIQYTQEYIIGTNVNKIEDHNHVNPNHEERFTTWEELFFCF